MVEKLKHKRVCWQEKAIKKLSCGTFSAEFRLKKVESLNFWRRFEKGMGECHPGSFMGYWEASINYLWCKLLRLNFKAWSLINLKKQKFNMTSLQFQLLFNFLKFIFPHFYFHFPHIYLKISVEPFQIILRKYTKTMKKLFFLPTKFFFVFLLFAFLRKKISGKEDWGKKITEAWRSNHEEKIILAWGKNKLQSEF